MTATNRRHASCIPLDLNRLSLNLRAYCDLPPKGEPLEVEVKRLMAMVASGRIGQTEGTEAVLRIIGRELDLFADAVKDALPHGYTVG